MGIEHVGRLTDVVVHADEDQVVCVHRDPWSLRGPVHACRAHAPVTRSPIARPPAERRAPRGRRPRRAPRRCADRGSETGGASSSRSANRNGSVGISVRPVSGWSSASNSLRCRSCGLCTMSRAAITTSAGTPFAASASATSAASLLAHQAARRASRSSWASAAGRGGERGIGRPPQVRAQRLPLLVVRHREGHPRVVAGAAVDALRCGDLTAVARPSGHHSVEIVLEHRLDRGVQRGLDHGRLDQEAPAGLVPLAEREQRGEDGVHAGERVAAPRTSTGGPSGNGPPREAGDRLHGLREPGPIAHGPSRPKAGMRTRTTAGFTAWRRSQPSPNCP